MSVTSINPSTATPVQSLSRTIMQEFDVNKDGQFSYDEFSNFLDGLVRPMIGQKDGAGRTGSEASAATATSLFLTANGASSSASATAFRDRMHGFNFDRFESAKGSTKYDAANIMQGIDPNDPDATQKLFQQMQILHPGASSLHAVHGDLMLNGAADGYIGRRPLDRSENWDNAPSGYVWQWMAYNDSHLGPNGENT
jgi:hypothetical protein